MPDRNAIVAELLKRHGETGDSPDRLGKLLTEFPGIGPTGADIFLREVQAVWPDIAPYVDSRVAEGARKLGLPTSRRGLANLVDPADLPGLAAALVRISTKDKLATEIKQAAAR